MLQNLVVFVIVAAAFAYATRALLPRPARTRVRQTLARMLAPFAPRAAARLAARAAAADPADPGCGTCGGCSAKDPAGQVAIVRFDRTRPDA